MQNYKAYTDLACESEITHDASESGTEYTEKTKNGYKVARLDVIGKKGEKATLKKRGTYVTIFSEMMTDIDGERMDALAKTISEEVKMLSDKLLGGAPSCVLVAGLGNREITADNIGPKTVDNLTVTRHLKIHAEKVFNSYFSVPVCAVAPGVLGQTGIEAADMLKGICSKILPDLVIVIDALAARSTKRLGATVQISDSGIAPGSGIGNHRSEISRESLGIPVIAIGVPTVVNSSTLVYDALCNAGYTELDSRIEEVLRTGESFFVSPKQIDEISECVSSLLASAINETF